MKRAHASGRLSREHSRVDVHQHDYRRDYSPGPVAVTCRVCGFRVSGEMVDLLIREQQ